MDRGESDARAAARRFSLAAACCVVVAAGVLDVLVAQLAGDIYLGDIGGMARAFLPTVVAGALVLAAVAALAWLAGRVLHRRPVRHVATYAGSLLAAFVLLRTASRHGPAGDVVEAVHVAVVVAASLAIAGGLDRLMDRLQGRAAVVVLVAFSVLLLALSVLFVRYLMYERGGLRQGPVSTYALYVALGWLLLGGCWGLQRWLGHGLLWLASASLVGLGALGCWASADHGKMAGAAGRRGHKVRHVVLVTIDTLRADALPLHGNPRVKTPALTGLARHAVTFERAYSTSPWTKPAIGSLLTGLPPDVHTFVHPDSRLPAGARTLAERLREAGYRTAAIGYNPYLRDYTGTARGFEEYHWFPLNPQSFGGRLYNRLFRPCKLENATATLTDLARDWLARHAREDFFLWLHYYDPHLPYTPPPAWFTAAARRSPARFSAFHNLDAIRNQEWLPSPAEKARLRDLYESEVQYVDHALGEVVAALASRGLLEDALLVVTSDHGEEFWEHEGFEHGHTVYDELVHVPLLVKPPRFRGAARVDEPVSLLSILPTILDVCGLEYRRRGFAPPLTGAWQGDPASVTVGALVSNSLLYGEERTGLIFGHWKYVRRRVNHLEELYDLDADPGETRSLAATDRANLRRARTLLRDYEARCARQRQTLAIEAARARRNRNTERLLRTHGYLR